MSDAAENVEIEDVLASIRRLVSDEVTRELQGRDEVQSMRDAAGDAGDRESAETTDIASDTQSDALVLSASFRVAETSDAESGADQPEPTADHGEPDDPRDPVDELAAAQDQETASSDGSDSLAPEGTDDAASAIPEDVLSAVADQIANWDASEDEHTEAHALQDTEAEASDDAEDVSQGDVPDEAPSQSDVTPLNLAEIGAQIHPDSDEPDEASDGDSLLQGVDTEQDGLESKIARLERLIGTQDNGWEPESEDAPQPDLAAPLADTIEWRDADTDPEDAPEEVSATPPISAPSIGAGDSEGEALLDEDALRGMVAAIVREELQGALGERITRNVRKLVRREIHRALASQELD